jgi:hypothetical protein
MSTAERIEQIDQTAVRVRTTGYGQYQAASWRGTSAADLVLISPADLEWLLHRARLSDAQAPVSLPSRPEIMAEALEQAVEWADKHHSSTDLPKFLNSLATRAKNLRALAKG